MPATSNPDHLHFQFLAEQMLRAYQHAMLDLCAADGEAARQHCAAHAEKLGQQIIRHLAIGLQRDAPF